VLAALTDPDVIRRWSPVDFELEGGARRLEAGRRAGVRGRLAGFEAVYDVHVHEADERGIRLRAQGPVPLDVAYTIKPCGSRASVAAQVVVNPGSGFTGRLLSKAVGSVLSAGALDLALGRLAAVASASARV
jgi:hypothetical protein